ncbi:MAG TPA: diaminopimelate epimerase [Bacteroidales bacterium]|nr:diaminopimelate epimerase [Bacteroidales bacterium]HPT21707.1 diaminopimelate epimerase [Bacteroidales bacterium]
MKFIKMQGCGNDYVYIDGFKENVKDPSSLAIKVSDRHFGVGSDGLVLILPSETCDFRMRMFNADGSESQMCGNASRCLARYVYEEGLTHKKAFTLETLAGIKEIKLNFSEEAIETVTVDMGIPVLSPKEIPVKIEGDRVIEYPISVLESDYTFTPVSMGNPHAVIFVDDVEHFPLEIVGPVIERHFLFPERTNVEFIEVINRTHLKMRVWERGAGETLACGTGACSSVVAAVLNGVSDREATVELKGGQLEIKWENLNQHVYMTGDAVRVFEGELTNF